MIKRENFHLKLFVDTLKNNFFLRKFCSQHHKKSKANEQINFREKIKLINCHNFKYTHTFFSCKIFHLITSELLVNFYFPLILFFNFIIDFKKQVVLKWLSKCFDF